MRKAHGHTGRRWAFSHRRTGTDAAGAGMRCVFREPSIAIGPGADITAEYQSVSPNVHSGFHSLLPVICEHIGSHRDDRYRPDILPFQHSHFNRCGSAVHHRHSNINPSKISSAKFAQFFITINPLLTQSNVSSANTVSICVSQCPYVYQSLYSILTL